MKTVKERFDRWRKLRGSIGEWVAWQEADRQCRQQCIEIVREHTECSCVGDERCISCEIGWDIVEQIKEAGK